ncbi:hypothetical protein [Nitratireductor thuwali]|uniref:Phage tail protein n=1 Tax=Nitratireductor thuwali TaxID=2267699 RepID=A0ABY5MUJ0_9HYPH|nr:hypothetical protein NTH_03999 [Nitratireductor thuwali]
MAFTTTLFNHTTRLFMGQLVNLPNLKVMLLDSTAAFDPTNTTLEQVAGVGNAKEVSGSGWTAGGEPLANVVAATVGSDDGALNADEVRVRATAGDIGPAYALVIFDDLDANKAPLIYTDFGGALTAADGVDFLIPLSPFLTGTYTAP